MPKTGGIPDQCLSLPPTVSVGDVLEGFDHTKYAQPRIEYRLRALVRTRSPRDELKTVQGERAIIIIPCSEPSPPVDTTDFPGEFIGSMSNAFRVSFLGAQYVMMLSLPEPSAISIKPSTERQTTVLRLKVEIQATDRVEPKTNVRALARELEGLKFRIQPILRAKTYYSTEPFPVMPGQSMVTARGPIRLHDSVSKMSEVELASSSWQFRRSDDIPCYEEAVRTGSVSFGSSHSSSAWPGSQPSPELPSNSSSVGVWETSLIVPIELNGELLPTFCSAIASRQYSIIAQVRVKGARVKEFVLETPLQVCRSPCAAMPNNSEEGELLRPEDVGSVHQRVVQDLLSDDLVCNLSPGEIRRRVDNAVASFRANPSV